MKKRIGLLSFHESTSYGAFLQCFAMQTIINNMGYNCEFIDFKRHKNPINNQSLVDKTKNLIIKTLYLPKMTQQKKIKEIFAEYQKEYLNVGLQSYYSFNDLKTNPPVYDKYVVGSDQVWNPVNSDLRVYGFNFLNNKDRTVAYAPSIGMNEIPEKFKNDIKNYLSDINYMSCREKSGADELAMLLNRDVQHVLDPTFLLNRDEWKDYEKPVKIQKPYLLCYFLGSLKYERIYAYKIAKILGLQIVMIPGSPVDFYTPFKTLYDCNPFQFLWMIHNAEYVCTDSFHGIALSINFDKNFSAFMRRGYESKYSYASRIISILKLLKCENRLLKQCDDIEVHLNTKRQCVQEMLSKEREESKRFISKALSF